MLFQKVVIVNGHFVDHASSICGSTMKPTVMTVAVMSQVQPEGWGGRDDISSCVALPISVIAATASVALL